MSVDFASGLLVGVLAMSLAWLGVNFMADRATERLTADFRPLVMEAAKAACEAMRLVPVASAPPPAEPPKAGQPTMNLLEP
ncbi:MAG TPA: hypothetical protein VF244_08180 [Acidimicrobiales bacterium]